MLNTDIDVVEEFSSKNILQQSTSSTKSTRIIKAEPEVTLYEGAYDYDYLKRRYFDKGYLIRSIEVKKAALYYECLSGFSKYPIRNITSHSYDIKYECITNDKEECVVDVKCDIPGRIQPSLLGDSSRVFNCNDKDQSADQKRICNLLRGDYNCTADLPTTTTTPIPTTTTQKTCPSFQELLDINLPKQKENNFTNKLIFNEEALTDHLLKDHKELSSDYNDTIIMDTNKTKPVTTTTTTNSPTIIGAVLQ